VALPFRFVYSPRYDLNLGPHVFPAVKYRLVREQLLALGVAAPEDFEEPQPARDDDLLRVHTREWVTKLRTGALSAAEIERLEIPYSPEMVEAVWLAVGGSILAGDLALRHGLGFNIGGGFHHAFPDHGEGFCPLNDVAVAIRRLQHEGRIQRAMVVDVDVHHGNGTAAVFHDDPSVFTLSIHQYRNYPFEKPPSDLDIHLEDACSDEEYLHRLAERYPPAMFEFQPDLIFHVAGADPYHQDQLGGLALTLEGLKRRDRLVIETARRQGIPVAVVLAGGYAMNVADTVTIHVNTATAAKEVMLAEKAKP
jgi:acetoin utilization deacetylase AcuC-like enzyme